MNDPLAKFRRKGDTPPAAAEARDQRAQYQAYQPTDTPQLFLEIRPRQPDPAEAPHYAGLTHIRGEWRWGQMVTLEYGIGLTVTLKGEGLTELFRALQQWRVAWVQEFDPEAHEEPANPDAPIITSIEVLWSDDLPAPKMLRH